jgi:hypothetical protein
MIRISDRLAARFGLRTINTKVTPASEFRRYAENNPQFKLIGQIKRAMWNYTPTGKFKVVKFARVPYPSYEEKYGGPYSHILTVVYDHPTMAGQWECVFGLTTTGRLTLWMD